MRIPPPPETDPDVGWTVRYSGWIAQCCLCGWEIEGDEWHELQIVADMHLQTVHDCELVQDGLHDG
jgi:hypothetical protein